MPSAPAQKLQEILDSVDFTFVQGPDQAGQLIQEVEQLASTGDYLGVDTETTGLSPVVNRVRLVQVASRSKALVVDLDGWRTDGERKLDWTRSGLRELAELLEGPLPKVLQNAAFDLNFLLFEGIDIGGKVFDTMIASKVRYNGQAQNKNDLGSVVKNALGLELAKELQKADWSGEITEEMLKYSARDALVLPHLVAPLGVNLKQTKLVDVYLLEASCLRPIAQMQAHGFRFDVAAAQELKDALEAKAEGMKLALCENLELKLQLKYPGEPTKWLPRNPDGTFNLNEKESGSIRKGTKVLKGFNPRSAIQMAQKLEEVGIVLKPGETGKPSMDQNLLAFVRKHPGFEIVDEYLEWKSVETQVSQLETLLESVGPDGRIHAGYKQMGTDTGRMSCSGPNLQQVNRSKEFRRLFIAEDGYILVVADFSQVELRVAGELSGEQRIIDAYVAGRDLHTETASLIKEVPFDEVSSADRTSAKITNFGLLYGAGPATLQKQAVAQYGIEMDYKTAKGLVEGFREAYPDLYRWQTQVGEATTKSVSTKIGRRRIVAGTFNDKYTTRINTQVQGTAGDIAKISISNLWDKLTIRPQGEARLIAMCHDELVLEVREGTEEYWAMTLKSVMEQSGAVVCQKVPIVAEVSWGKTWADAK